MSVAETTIITMDEKNRAYVGQRDRKVEVVEYTSTKNALNEDVKTESSIGFFYAKMVDLSGAEDEEGKVIHIVNRTYTIAFLNAIRVRGENMVVKDEGQEFKIYYVQEIGRKMQLLLKCTVRE